MTGTPETMKEIPMFSDIPHSVDEIVPFSRSILACLPEGINPKDYETLVSKTTDYTKGYLRIQSVRRYSSLGIVYNLLDKCQTPKDASDILIPIGNKLVAAVRSQNSEFQQDLWDTLRGTATARALIFLDTLLGETVTELKLYRGEKVQHFIELVDEQIKRFDISQIVYTPNFHPITKNVIEIRQQYKIAPLTHETLNMLWGITPRFLVRGPDGKHEECPFDSPQGILGEIERLGIPFARTLADYCKTPEALDRLRRYYESRP
jgi:hypothetical protein